MVNEVALVLLFGMFGWQVAALYLAMGLLVAIVSGLVIGRLRMERHLEDCTEDTGGRDYRAGGRCHELGRALRIRLGPHRADFRPGLALRRARHRAGGRNPRLCPRGFHGLDHGQRKPGGRSRSPCCCVPMYTNAAGIIPVVQALIGKGAALGTVLAFMMAVIGLSAPEIVILRKVLKPTLIATFAGVVSVGILIVGYVFNAVL